jgi:hypothetical protein
VLLLGCQVGKGLLLQSGPRGGPERQA